MKTDAEHMRDALRSDAGRMRQIMTEARLVRRDHRTEMEGIAKDLELAANVLDRVAPPAASKALELVARLLADSTLSEGQVATALGIDRVEARKLADEAKLCGLCGCAICGCGRRYNP